MKNEYAKELTHLTSSLQETRDFKANRLRVVYDRKVSALCETFVRLANLERTLREYVTRFGVPRSPDRDAARKAFAQALDDFETFFVPNRIFFPLALAEAINTLKNEMNQEAIKFMAGMTEGMPAAKSGAAWERAANYVEAELPKHRRTIEAKIRAELGEKDLES